MVEFLTEKNKSIYFDYFGVNEKKFFGNRVLLTIVLLAAYLFLTYSFNNWWLLIGIPFVMLIGFKLPYLRLMSLKEKDDIIKQYVFPTFLRYFISLIETKGNVYQTLKSIVPYLDNPIKAELERLITKIDRKNVSNRDAFMEFAEYIGSGEALMIMSMIYEFNEEGIRKDDLKELENIIEQLQENKTNELIEYKVAKMDKYANPIILYTITYILCFAGLVLMAYIRELH